MLKALPNVFRRLAYSSASTKQHLASALAVMVIMLYRSELKLNTMIDELEALVPGNDERRLRDLDRGPVLMHEVMIVPSLPFLAMIMGETPLSPEPWALVRTAVA